MMLKTSPLILAALFATLTVACGPAPSSQITSQGQQTGVIGGDSVTEGSTLSRSTVALYDKKNGGLCTGTLITPTTILTAAHCVVAPDAELFAIFALEVEKADASLIRRVVQAIPHPSYDPKGVEDINDIAIVKLNAPAPAGHSPARLASPATVLREGARVTVAGYGLSWSWGVHLGAGKLRTTSLKVKNATYGNTEFMLSQSIRHGVCSGDSGGPAYIEGTDGLYVVGVVSRGDSLPIPLTPNCFMISIFTKVDAHLDWIATNVGN